MSEQVAAAPYVVKFNDPEARQLTLVGGKAVNLARLARADFPVPGGFVVTTAAYHALVDDTDVPNLVQALTDLDAGDADGVAAAGAELRTTIRSLSFPDAVRAAIEDAHGHAGSGQAFAARSSATAEDLPNVSFAGQHETVLNVRDGDVLVNAVRECMASLFTDRAIIYRARNDIPHNEVALAVVVQEMVQPDASGVLFTADPATGNRTVSTIEAGFGLGEAHVQGTVATDLVKVDNRTGVVLEYDVGDKRVAVQSQHGGGTERVELPAERRSARVLGDSELRELVADGRRIEDLFDAPQDIEWCRADGELYILQSRPITSLFPLPSPAPDDDLVHVYYSWGHKQAMPDAMPPLVVDLWRRVTRAMTRELGFADLLGEWTAESGGRVYHDLTPFGTFPSLRNRLVERLGSIDEPAAEALEAYFARRDPYADVRPDWLGLSQTTVRSLRSGGPTLLALLSGIAKALTVGDTDDIPARETEWYDRYAEHAVERVRAQSTADDRVRAAIDELECSIFGVFERFFPIYAALISEAALRRLSPEREDGVDTLGKGIPGDAITEMTLALGDLADVAREHPAVADALSDGKPLDEVRALDGGEAFAAAVDEFLDRYGFRGPAEIDISRPRWREDPTPLLQVVRGNLASEETGAHRERFRRLVDEAEAAGHRLEVAASRRRFGFFRAALVRHLVDVYRGYIGIREHPKYGIAKLLAETRLQVLAAGDRLAEEGRLDDPDDVWYLRLDELLALLSDPNRERKVDIGRRRTDFERYAAMDAPRVMTSEGEILTPPDADRPENVLTGTPVSGGVVEGPVRVITDPADTVVEPGEIIVGEYCDPGWTPLFLNAAGMVMEVGGLLTHGSLVAREYGIPAVVSVPDATDRLETGQQIRLDGTRGTIEVLD